MDTKALFSVLPIKKIVGTLPHEITDLEVDSRAVQMGGVFVCIEGFTVDGHQYVEQAVNNGAKVIVASKEIDVNTNEVAVVYVKNTARAIALLAPKYFNYPSKKMKMIGVTGTNGKTSVSGMIHSILQKAGETSAVSGTIGFNLNGTLYETENTTGDVLATQRIIAQAAREHCQTMTMEVSSHGLVEGRLAGTEFDLAIFTNLTRDHLDFHGTMENYADAKGLLFAQLGQDLSQQKAAIVNRDDPWYERFIEKTSHPIFTYGIDNEADFMAKDIALFADKTTFTLSTIDGAYPVEMKLIGQFSVYNALATIAALYAKGMALEEVIQHLATIEPIKGRMEKVESDLPITMYVDYAHTDDAIKKAIEAVLPYKEKKLIFLIGTGGNRDREKRPIMANEASKADYVILTTDDPRDEPYESILLELEAGMLHDNYACIGDREEAVKHAIAIAEAGDIIIFAGKGHEDFQIIGRTKYPHSDAEIALEAGKVKFQAKELK